MKDMTKLARELRRLRESLRPGRADANLRALRVFLGASDGDADADPYAALEALPPSPGPDGLREWLLAGRDGGNGHDRAA